MEERFDARFELESEGCSECSGYNLIDKKEISYPIGKYFCEYNLNKIKSFIQQEIELAKKEERERIVRILKNLLEEEARYGDTPEYDLLERILKEINIIKK